MGMQFIKSVRALFQHVLPEEYGRGILASNSWALYVHSCGKRGKKIIEAAARLLCSGKIHVHVC